jgi:ketosteroid isomerase-like protein
MGARGPHDDFESAKKLIVAVLANFNLSQDFEEIRDKFLADDLEYVTRHGTFHGPDRYVSDFGVQLDRWIVESEVDEVIDAGDGAIVVFVENKRIDKETKEVAWKAWPALVVRVLDGKLVFFEGYVDRRRAMADLGLQGG